MRADARSLLDRIGRSDFAYKEFADRFSDLELWPLFEALLKDPRLFLQDISAKAATEAQPSDIGPATGLTAPHLPAHPATPATPAPAPFTPPVAERPMPPSFPEPAAPPLSGSESLAELFSRYEESGVTRPQDPRNPDVRAMLRRLSDLGERGEL